MGNITIRAAIVALLLVSTLGMVRAKIVWTEWSPSTTNTDGSPLTDLAGYNIYISVPQPSSTPTGPAWNYPVVTVDPSYTKWPFWVGIHDDYYVQISAINSAGRESAKTPKVLISGRTPPMLP